MAVDRDSRGEIAANIALLMRDQIRLRDVRQLRQRLFPKNSPVADSLGRHALQRLDKHWWGAHRRGRLQATSLQWEKLRRWIAILHTDIDWDAPRQPAPPLPKQPYAWLGCVPIPLTLCAFVLASQIYDGLPVIIWVLLGCIAVPIIFVCMRRQARADEKFSPRPFWSFDELNRYIHLANTYELPVYDPKRHGPTVVTNVWRFLQIAPFLAPGLVALVAIWPGMIVAMWLERRENEFYRRASAEVTHDDDGQAPTASKLAG